MPVRNIKSIIGRELFRGGIFGLGFLGAVAMGALTAQVVADFSAGEVVSASAMNERFAAMRTDVAANENRLNNPLPVQFVDPPVVTITSASLTDVPGFELTITTRGEPVWLGLNTQSGPGGAGTVQLTGAPMAIGCHATVAVARNGVTVYSMRPRITHGLGGGTGGIVLNYPASAFWFIDTPGAGTFTYKLRAGGFGTGCESIQFAQVRMLAWRILPR